jgi:hypothetical protein
MLILATIGKISLSNFFSNKVDIYTRVEALIMWQAQWEVRVDQVAKLGMVWGQQLEVGQQGTTKVGEK